MELHIKKGSAQEDWKEQALSLLQNVRLITSFDEGSAIRFEVQGEIEEVVKLLTKEGFEVKIV